MTKYRRVSRRIINRDQKMSVQSNETTTRNLPRLGSETVPNEMPLDLPKEIGPTLQKQRDIDEGVTNGCFDGPEFGPPVPKYFPVKKERQTPKWTKVGVGLGVMVPLILLVIYHYEQLSVTSSSYFRIYR